MEERGDGRGALTRHQSAHPCLGGTGYPLWRREELVDLYEDLATRYLVPRSNRRSIRRWMRRRNNTGTLHRDPMNQGRKRRMSALEIGICFVTKRARPTASEDELANMITHQTGRVFSRVAVSRALNHYGSWGNMSRKGVEQCPRERDPLRRLRRAMWRLHPPRLCAPSSTTAATELLPFLAYFDATLTSSDTSLPYLRVANGPAKARDLSQPNPR